MSTDTCCIGRKASAACEWHRRRGEKPCERAKALRSEHHQNIRRKRAEAEGRVFRSRPECARPNPGQKAPSWNPGTSILVPEVDPL